MSRKPGFIIKITLQKHFFSHIAPTDKKKIWSDGWQLP